MSTGLLTAVLEDGGDVPAGEGATGRLVATGLLNSDFPLIRYATGDRGRLAPTGRGCACGRSLPRLDGVEGRSQDSIVTRDGRRIFWLNPVFYGLPVRQAQIIQESLDRIRVRVVPGDGFEPGGPRSIVERLRDRVGGGVEVRVETVAEIGRTAAGKLRPVVSLVARSEGARA